MESVRVFAKPRNNTISIAKAVGIILMVIGHVFDKESWYVHYIYMFHMPLFFVLSGYFFKNSSNSIDVKIYVWKRIKGLYLPFIKWTIFFILIHNFLLQFHLTDGVYDTQSIVVNILKSSVSFVGTEPILVGFWFLKALFTAAVWYQLLSYISFKCRLPNVILPTILLLLVLIQMMLCSKNKTLLGMNLGALFMYVGTTIREYKIGRKFSNVKVNTLIALVIFVLSRSYTDVFHTEMLQVDKTTVLPFMLSGVLGSLFVLYLSSKLKDILRGNLRKLIVYIGDNTMIILALHYPFYKIFQYSINLSDNKLAESIMGGNWSVPSYCLAKVLRYNHV